MLLFYFTKYHQHLKDMCTLEYLIALPNSDLIVVCANCTTANSASSTPYDACMFAQQTKA